MQRQLEIIFQFGHSSMNSRVLLYDVLLILSPLEERHHASATTASARLTAHTTAAIDWRRLYFST